MQQYAARSLVNVFGCGDESDACLFKDSVNVYVVGAVAGEAVEFVDYDVVDFARFLDVGEHLLQCWAFGASG